MLHAAMFITHQFYVVFFRIGKSGEEHITKREVLTRQPTEHEFYSQVNLKNAAFVYEEVQNV